MAGNKAQRKQAKENLAKLAKSPKGKKAAAPKAKAAPLKKKSASKGVQGKAAWKKSTATKTRPAA